MRKKIIRNILIGIICCFFLTFTEISIVLAAKKSASSLKRIAKSETATPKAKKAKPVPDKKNKAVQKALNKAGFKLEVDGLMGKRTQTAIKGFQKKNGLKVTGTPDKATLAKLKIK